MMVEKRANRLIDEKSPYLRMHAHNPVDWYPWGEEAFARAKAENLPIFLSIGYATCHWCHVMERESFDDEEVAALLNEGFVAIKVDREERPDLDSLYMIYAQVLFSSPGWPLTVIMTPDQKPFFAASYIPKNTAYGRRGLMDLLPEIAGHWQDKKDTILDSSEKLHAAIEEMMQGARGSPDEAMIHGAYNALKRSYDSIYGGFGNAPKFPMPHMLVFLFRYWHRYREEEALNMAVKTLEKMYSGGIHDHLGGGFHRYSTDREWLVPHFEKMLYDQALLLIACADAWQATGNPLFRLACEDIAGYVLRDMQSEEGGFYSAMDADTEGEEGKYYLWTEAEFRQVLKEDASSAEEIFNIRPDGNFLDEATGMYNGKNILWRSRTDRDVQSVRERLAAARSRRNPPLVDTKVLTDWNGLMIAALAKAGAALDRPEWVAEAARAYDLIATASTTPGGRLLHRYCDAEAAIPGMLDDYAFLLWGLLELYEATYEGRYLKEASELADIALSHFAGEDGALYQTPDDEKVLIRQKSAYDGAIPSGTSVFVLSLLRLSHMTANPEYRTAAERAMEWYADEMQASPTGFTHLLSALLFAESDILDLVIVPGRTDDPEILRILRETYAPHMTSVMPDSIAPHTAGMVPGAEEKTLVHICRGGACLLPLKSAEEVREALLRPQGS